MQRITDHGVPNINGYIYKATSMPKAQETLWKGTEQF